MKNIIDYTQFLNESHSDPRIAQLLNDEKEKLDSWYGVMQNDPDLRTQESNLTAYMIEGIGAFLEALVAAGGRDKVDQKVLADLMALSKLEWDNYPMGWFFDSYRDLLNQIDPDKSM